MNMVRLKSLKLFIQALILGVCFANAGVFAQTLPLSPNLIGFNSNEGEKLLIGSKSREDFFPLSMQFVTQINQAYCGVASMIMVLNGLGVTAPEVSQYKPYNVFTQENFFSNEKTREAMNTTDSDSGKKRGFVFVSKN